MRTETTLQVSGHHAHLVIQQSAQWRTGIDVVITLKHATGLIPIRFQSVAAGDHVLQAKRNCRTRLNNHTSS